MNRPEMLSRVNAQTQPWDMLIVGGGATGVGVAVDAASRGYDVLLFEQSDFGKGTSSRSTKLVINAAGAFSDSIRQMVSPGCSPLIAPSQGIHLVFDRSFLRGSSAIMVPNTSNGRVLFAIPWHGHTLVGTTDTSIDNPSLEPIPMEAEVEFILTTAARYLHKAPTRDDILSAFAGIRPLVRAGDSQNAAALSRDHTIHIDRTGLLNITGGKWTTYRHMAEDCVDQAAMLARLEEKPCATSHLNIHGFHKHADKFEALAVYGADAPAIEDLIRLDPSLGKALHPALPYCRAEVIWAARFEMARTVDDILARRTRALFLNARAAIEMAPLVAELMAKELGRDERWIAGQISNFIDLAKGYLVPADRAM